MTHLTSILRGLTIIQHGSTPFMIVFGLVHLSAPVAASIGGSALSSQFMLIGREYYQSALSEPLLVYAPFTLHIAASFLKRLLLGPPVKPGLLQMSAYPLLAFLPIHVLTNRIYPSDPASPVLALSPSELDYEYVKYGLIRWPWRSIALYGGLTVYIVIHSIEGIALMSRVWFSGRSKRKWGWKRWTTALGSCAAAGAGILSLSSESLLIPRDFGMRVHYAYMKSFLFRL